MERVAVEHGSEAVVEARVLDGHRPEDMCRLAQTVGRHTRLHADARPGLVQRAVQPEARLVLEQDYALASLGFFLIAGSRSFIHTACSSGLARAKRFRGRCTEKPSRCSSRGRWWL